MPPNHLHAFLSGEGDLRVLTACPFCSVSYSLRAARVLAQRDDAHLVHIECRNCGGSIVALILGGAGAQSIGVVTDLTRDEVEKYSTSSSVGADDVVALYDLLRHEAQHALLLNPAVA